VAWSSLLVQGSAGGHAAGQPFDAGPLEVRDAAGVGGDDGHRVRGVHEEAAFTQHHVTVLREGGGVNRNQQQTRVVTFREGVS